MISHPAGVDDWPLDDVFIIVLVLLLSDGQAAYRLDWDQIRILMKRRIICEYLYHPPPLPPAAPPAAAVVVAAAAAVVVVAAAAASGLLNVSCVIQDEAWLRMLRDLNVDCMRKSLHLDVII